MPNDAADHTFSWVSPHTYRELKKSFQPQAQAATPPATPTDKLVVSGSIGADGKTTLFPFYILKTSQSRPNSAGAGYSIVLLGGGGQALATYRFTPHQTSRSPTLAFNEFVLWKAGHEADRSEARQHDRRRTRGEREQAGRTGDKSQRWRNLGLESNHHLAGARC